MKCDALVKWNIAHGYLHAREWRTVRLPKDIADSIDAEARKQGISRSEMVSRAIRKCDWFKPIGPNVDVRGQDLLSL